MSGGQVVRYFAIFISNSLLFFRPQQNTVSAMESVLASVFSGSITKEEQIMFLTLI